MISVPSLRLNQFGVRFYEALLSGADLQSLVGFEVLSFGPGSAYLGGLDWLGLAGVGTEPNADYAATIPHQAFMIYQAMFAVITPALITGAIAERMKFKSYVVFLVLWATLVYDPIAHWVWAVGGVLRKMGALGMFGLRVPVERGGVGLGPIASCVLAESLGRASTFAGFDITVLVHTDMATPHLLHSAAKSSSRASWTASCPARCSPPSASPSRAPDPTWRASAPAP